MNLKNKIIHGNSLEKLKAIPDKSLRFTNSMSLRFFVKLDNLLLVEP